MAANRRNDLPIANRLHVTRHLVKHNDIPPKWGHTRSVAQSTVARRAPGWPGPSRVNSNHGS